LGLALLLFLSAIAVGAYAPANTWISATLATIAGGILVSAFPRSISDNYRKHLRVAEQELRQSRERFERALSGSASGLWEWNIEQSLAWYSPRFKQLLGYDDDEFPNEISSWTTALHQDDWAHTHAALERHLNDEQDYDVEYRLKTKSGSYRWFEARGVAVRDPAGKPYLMAGSIQDIHIRKQAQEQVRERDEQLRHAQKMEAIGTLAGGIAHEFNNLLQVINGYARYALDGLDEGDPRAKDLQQVLIAGDRAATLTRQLLNFGRRSALQLSHVNTDHVVSELVTMLRPMIGEHISIELTQNADHAHVRADTGQLQQALMNLCVNSRDAMPNGGVLRISTNTVNLSATEAGSLALKPGFYVTLSVADTGCGMPADVRERMYEPFFTTKDVGKGSGLGLAMVYSVVQQHQGTICCHSSSGTGSTLTIYLPCVDSDEIQASSQLDLFGPRGTETILVAEDESSIRELAMRILQRAGYTVIVAADGAEALQRFEEHMDDVSVALLDAVMPLYSGREVYERMLLRKPSMKAVFFTGYDSETAQLEVAGHGELIVIQKPFESAVLLRIIRDVISEECTCQLV
jgi:PAS domain S-box-containing protein